VPFVGCRDDGLVIRVRAAVLGAVLWCVVVAAVSSLVWVVISRAGAGVVPGTQPQADVTGSLPVPGAGHASGRPSPGVTLTPWPTHEASSSSTSPSAATSTPVLPPPSSSSPSSSSSVSTTPPAPVSQRRSWSGPPGHVVAECRGPAVHLVAAYPNAGWRYDIGSRGPELVQVRFVRVGEDGRSVTVEARCGSGVPDFTLAPHEPGDS
jgi:hypothetical protein